MIHDPWSDVLFLLKTSKENFPKIQNKHTNTSKIHNLVVHETQVSKPRIPNTLYQINESLFII